MNDDELQRELLNEVPNPESGYWDRIDGLLASQHTEVAAASANKSDDGSKTETVADITVARPAPGGPLLSGDRQRSIGRVWRWPATAAAAALLILGGWFMGSRMGSDTAAVDLAAQPEDNQVDGDAVGPKAALDHWNSVYAVWDCTAEDGGAWLPVFESTVDDYGIHSHGDGLISIHPFTEVAAGTNARFGLFAETMGIEVAVDAITLDDGRRLEAGTDCGGEPAVVHLRRWQYDFEQRSDPSFVPTVITSDFNDERFFNDREVWVIAFAPLDADLPSVPAERFDQLDGRTAPSTDLRRSEPSRFRTPPPADFYLRATAGLGDGPLAQELHSIRQAQYLGVEIEHAPRDSTSPTTHHVASVQAPSRTLDIFRSSGGDASPTCLSIFSTSPGNPGRAFVCGSESLAAKVGVVLDDGLVAAIATNAPQDARWMMIETSDGIRIVTDVVDGIAYAEWSGTRQPASITLLNAAMELVFTQESP